MKTAFLMTLLRSTSAVLMAVGIVATASLQPTVAQTVDQLDNSLSGDGDSSDPFSGRGNQSGSLLDLIHRVTLGNDRTPSEYNSTQQENLGTAATDFRTRQLELLRQQNQNQPGTQESSETPAESN
ncbi:hypothetical protein H6F93_26190 [Leptolyngbya sp. FACHB-671]|uniref:hypothetical protein n=1 Tax=Leptolyngbya sp. FACHB-671 TaxID=2692812 RepID=UPI001685DF35|nr:hypothetical protein [Leptolyngbya sp. FACHB-671]MBD2070965.1 hypothetical protein [Leptolyngbya sp. FACHB-671]